MSRIPTQPNGELEKDGVEEISRRRLAEPIEADHADGCARHVETPGDQTPAWSCCTRSDREESHTEKGLYQRYRADIQDTVRFFLGRRYVADVDDVCQSVFERVLKALRSGRVQATSDLRGYVRTAARNAAFNWERRGRRELPVEGLEPLHIIDPEDPGRVKEDIALCRLDAALSAVPKELGELYKLRFVERHSQTRSAQKLGVSRQRLRTLERRLKEHLRQVIVDTHLA